MDAAHFQRIAKALADPRRFEILQTIAASGDEMCCGSVVECFPVAQATVSHHLKELTHAGLIETRTEGQFKYLRACPDVLTEYLDELSRRLGLQRGQTPKQKSASRRKAARA
jgi:ArsR family transcriptional regulator, arsenate/arsenite/antimonite-responsive transcriptional repressor